MPLTKIVNFRGTCSARSSLVLSSPRLPGPFQTQRIHLHFAPGCQGLLDIEPYLSPDAVCPATGPPTGIPLLSGVAQDTRFRGDAESPTYAHQVAVPESGYALKVYAVNDDFYDHAVDVQITIQTGESLEV